MNAYFYDLDCESVSPMRIIKITASKSVVSLARPGLVKNKKFTHFTMNRCRTRTNVRV